MLCMCKYRYNTCRCPLSIYPTYKNLIIVEVDNLSLILSLNQYVEVLTENIKVYYVKITKFVWLCKNLTYLTYYKSLWIQDFII